MNTAESTIDPKKVNKAIGYACRILSIQEYSIKSISKKILSKGYSTEETSLAIAFLLENNWLNEERFCEVFLRSKINRGQGFSRIRFELHEKGISNQLLTQVLNKQEPVDWQIICDSVAERKVNSASLQNNLKDRQKLERFLRYRGFSGEQIRVSIEQYIIKNNMGVTPSEYDE